MKRLFYGAWAGFVGGACGGVLAGLGEALLLALTSSSLPDFGFVPYAVLGYGLFGALGGAGLGAVLATFGAGNLVGLPGGAVLGSIAFVVGRYHVDQRLFREELSFGTFEGLVAHAVLLLVAGALFAGLAWIGARRARRPGWGIPAFLAVVATASILVGGMRVADDTVRGAGPSVAAPAGGPNVVLIVVDTLRWDAVSANADTANPTPAIDSLAADGVRFERAYAQASWTRPSIATILTSLHPSRHGATHKTALLRGSVLTVAEAFRDAGYWTRAFVSNINVAPVFNFHQGFVEYTYLAPEFYFGATDTAARLTLYKLLRMLRERFWADVIYPRNFYQDGRVVSDRAIRWLEENPRQPFFLFLHYMDPHDPYFEIPYSGKGVARVRDPSPDPSRRDELRSLYGRNTGYGDGEIGRVLEVLKKKGLYRDALIVLTSDHGEEFYEHRGWWHGTTLYEEQVHVPLVVKLPGNRSAGSVVRHPVRLLDVAPTLLGQAGLEVPEDFEGKDLFGDYTPPDLLWAEEELEGNVLSAVRAGPWKLVLANPGNPRGLDEVELYHLGRDPGETENLASRMPEKVEELLALAAGRGWSPPVAPSR
ncbi:MAG: hypothetical protein KatS3mg076_0467 [Candidatus Binatia bacterium]|nr:MAG: hypothetical protein KatS3mg076_0467 [Candidatus Binatia bacterium]